jgi:sn-glycerol 3-phosphate transport system substrate-binding protein
MKRRTLLAGAFAAGALPAVRRARAQGKIRIQFWHAMGAALGDTVNRLAAAFNAQDGAAEVSALFKGNYPDTLTASIAAWRAGQAPHIVQVYDAGQRLMFAAGPAVKLAHELIAETRAPIDPDAFIPAIRAFYSLPDGRMAAVPFNSSSALMWINADAFQRAGLDAAQPPATWPELVTAARALKARNAVEIPLITSSTTWIETEQYGAINDLPYATAGNGFESLDAELLLDRPQRVAHLQRLLDLSRDGVFRYAGRDDQSNPLFFAGQAGVMLSSSGTRGQIARDAHFAWRPALLPVDPTVNPTPLNSLIGGAALWAMTAPQRTAAEYEATARFLAFLGKPENDSLWHQETGYVPVTVAGYERARAEGYYERTPGADLAIQQLRRGHVTANSRGIRLGRFPEIRTIIYEEFERAVQGNQNAQTAMNSAVARGNVVLREFARSTRSADAR